MNKYFVYNTVFGTISGPTTFKEAEREKREYTNWGDAVIILKMVVDKDGKVVD